MEIKPEDVKQVVEREDDFGHELRVGHIFETAPISSNGISQSEKISAVHGGTYTDPSTGKPRQFDYQFEIHLGGIRNGRRSAMAILFAVECKNLHATSPLVVCGLPRVPNEAIHNIIEAGKNELGAGMATVKSTFQYPFSQFYPVGEFVGKSLLRLSFDNKSKSLKTETQSDIYDRWAQAVQSAAGLAESALSAQTKYKLESVSSAVMPVVVVPDGLLWKAQYEQTGKIAGDPMQCDSCTFYIGRRLDTRLRGGVEPFFMVSHIHFVTLTGFSQLLNSFLKMGTNWGLWYHIFDSSNQAVYTF